MFRFEMPRSVITVQRDFRARLEKDTAHKNTDFKVAVDIHTLQINISTKKNSMV
jgi:hypothetical protein